MVQLITLSLLAAVAIATRLSPTADEVRSTFDQAQKFYSSGAYDQAIERYEAIAGQRTRLLDMDAVQVTVGDITAPLHEVAVYQIGNAHMRRAEEAAGRSAQSRDEAQKARLQQESLELFERAAESFVATEAMSTVPLLKALARSQAVACWYKMKDYGRAIDGARGLIERYPDSKYVIGAMYDIGWGYYESGEYAKSIEAFQALVDRFDTGYQVQRALFQIGESYFQLERYAEAIPHYRRLVDSQRIGQMTEREILLMQREKIAGLVDETALELAAKALIRMGVCYERTGDFARASEAFETVATQFGKERRLAEEAYLRHADMHYSRGDFEACIAVYRRAIQADADPFGKARLQLLLANRYFETEHYPEAVREYDYYRTNYGSRASRVGLSIEGVGLQIARAWFREAERRPPQERSDAYRRAEAELRSTLRAYPGSQYDVELRFNLALALQSQQDDGGKSAEALDILTTVVDDRGAAGYRASALFQRARLRHRQGDYAGAAADYRTLLTEMADRPEANVARFELAVVTRDAGDPRSAVEQFRQVGADHALYPRSRLEAGQVLVGLGDPLRAIEILREGLAAASPDDETAGVLEYLVGAALSRLEDYEAALPHFAAAIAQGGATLVDQAHYGRGVAHFRLGRLEAAIADLDREWADPEIARSAPRLLASAYATAGENDKALEVYRRLAAQTGTTAEQAEHLLAQAEIGYRQGRYDEVEGLCERLLALGPTEDQLPAGRPYYVREKAWFLAADSQVRRARFAAAIDRAHRGLAEYPAAFYTPDLWFIQGLALLQAGQSEAAVPVLDHVTRTWPDHGTAGYALYYLGYAYFNQALFAQAEEPFARSARDHGDLPVAADAFYRQAECKFNRRQFDEARRDYLAFGARWPDHELAEDALYNVAWCYMNEAESIDEASRSDEIRRAFTAYLAAYPGGEHAATARYTLAEMAYNEGRYPQAYEVFRAVETGYPGTEAARRAAEAIPELREAVAFQAYEEAMAAFERATQAQDERLLLEEAIPALERVHQEYGNTTSGIGAWVNVAVAYQKLERWREAVAIYDAIVAEGEAGNELVSENTLSFCQRRGGTLKRKHL